MYYLKVIGLVFSEKENKIFVETKNITNGDSYGESILIDVTQDSINKINKIEKDKKYKIEKEDYEKINSLFFRIKDHVVIAEKYQQEIKSKQLTQEFFWNIKDVWSYV